MTNNNFSMTAGTSKYVEFPILDSAGQPFNLTGAVVTWKLSKSNKGVGKTALVSKSSADSTILLTNTDENGITIILYPSDTNDLDGKYWHEVRLVKDELEEAWAGIVTIEGTTTYVE